MLFLAAPTACAALFAVGRAIGRSERRRSGMCLNRPADTGGVLRVSRWAGGAVDGSDTLDNDGCLRVYECEHGWLVERRWLFAGSGWLWFPHTESHAGDRFIRPGMTWVWVVESAGQRAEVRRRLGAPSGWRSAVKKR